MDLPREVVGLNQESFLTDEDYRTKLSKRKERTHGRELFVCQKELRAAGAG